MFVAQIFLLQCIKPQTCWIYKISLPNFVPWGEEYCSRVIIMAPDLIGLHLMWIVQKMSCLSSAFGTGIDLITSVMNSGSEK